MRTLLWTIVLCLFPGLLACRSSSAGSAGKPVGTWKLVELADADLAGLSKAAELTIGADGALSGYAGVNRFSGKTEAGALATGRLQAGPLIATRMAGPPAAMAIEARFLQLLGTPLEVKRNGANLKLLQDGVVKARFVAQR